MTELKIGPIIMITRTDFLLITARFSDVSSLMGCYFKHLHWKYFWSYGKIRKTQATAPKKQILAKAVLAKLETPPPQSHLKKNDLRGYRYVTDSYI